MITVKTESRILTGGYLLIALVSFVVYGLVLCAYGILIRPLTDWLSVHWWFWMWLLIYPFLIIRHQLRLRAQKRGEVLPPVGERVGGGTGQASDHQGSGDGVSIPADGAWH
jgi:hypothetical protein